MWSCDGAKIGAACRNNAVDVVDLRYRTDCDRLDAYLVSDAVGKRGLVHAPVYRLCGTRRLAGRDVNEVAACRLEEPGNFNGIVGRVAPWGPVVRRNAHAHRQTWRPFSTHRTKYFEWISAAVRKAAAVFVSALVGERRDKT